MPEFMTDIEDWSLQAIVRGPSGDFSKCLSSFSDDDYHYHLHQFDDGEFLPNFPDELEHLYKPFYHPAEADSLADPAPAPAVIEFQEQVSVVLADDKSAHSLEIAAVAAAPKYKRRKNLHKREVIQVSVDGLAADMWAWRKYGQKPIKGSPYPRSYYRCSSSKGCLARKQVEQSCTDPGMYIITYTAEHSHSQPTRRNSLAGTVRQKFPSSSSKTPYARQSSKPGKPDKSYSPKTIHQFSYSPSDDVIVPFDPRAEIKEESKDEDVARVNDNFGYSGGDDFIMSDFAMNEDFFSGLEEFDEFVSEIQASAQQFPVR